MKTITIPNGYNGHTIVCDAQPIAERPGVYTLRVHGSYMTMDISIAKWEKAVQEKK